MPRKPQHLRWTRKRIPAPASWTWVTQVKIGFFSPRNIFSLSLFISLCSSVAGSWHFGMDPDPDPRIRASDWRIRIWILPFSSVNFKTQKKLFFLSFSAFYFFKAHFTSFFWDKKSLRSQKTVRTKVFLIFFFFLNNRRIRIQSRTCHLRIRIL